VAHFLWRDSTDQCCRHGRRMEGQAGMRRGARPLLLLLAVAFLATACGRMGPIRPPGPAEEITHPRQYPNR
ncbi:MAG: hypothetical protein ACKPB8_10180, partial [Alphaproteobacteria bacterium]